MEQKSTAAYVTIDNIVMSALGDKDEQGTHNYRRYLHYALRCAQDWHFDSAQEVKTIELNMNDYNAVDWPQDYIDWTKIGVRYGDKVMTFGVNDDIDLLHNADECGNPIINASADTEDNINMFTPLYWGGYWFQNYINDYGEHMGRFYGYGGAAHGIGNFKLNKERRQFQFDSKVTAKKIYLEYISNGFDPCKETMVNRYAESMIRTYVHWQNSVFKEGPASSNSQAWELEYDKQLRLSRARVFELSVKDIINISREHYKLSIKT